MKRRWIILLSLVALPVLIVLLTGTEGGITRFSPQTLEYTSQSEYTICNGAIPVWRSEPVTIENETVTYLIANELVSPQPGPPRWEVMSHWNEARRDGQTNLGHVFNDDRHAIIEWSQANPELARIYWTEGFRYLRSDDEKQRLIGQYLLSVCRNCEDSEEFHQAIEEIKRVYW